MKKSLFISLLLLAGSSLYSALDVVFPSGKATFRALNANPDNPFVLSFGMSEAQASFQSLQNSANPEFILKKLQELAQQQSDPRAWLGSKDRIWYILRSLPKVSCTHCSKVIDPETFDLVQDRSLIEYILDDIARNKSAQKLTMTQCPHCHHRDGYHLDGYHSDGYHSDGLKTVPKNYFQLSASDRKAIVKQIDFLGVNRQVGCASGQLPNYRFSAEACSLLQEHTTVIDPVKLQGLAQFLQEIGNPLIFLHNYTNPLAIPDLFEKVEHIDWFANYCLQVMQACTNVTHVCPIVQPIAFGFRVSHVHNLPPFARSIGLDQYLNNLVQANIAACKKIKAWNPKIQTLVSHQWKIMKPVHGFGDPRRILESFICTIANRMYNQKFVDLYKPHSKHFDAISLSLYPPVRFNLWAADGDNCSGVIDAQSALEAIVAIHEAFPDKDIYIGETSSHQTDPVLQKRFIDMTLYVCKLARDRGIPVKGVYFWSHANSAYCEWNKAPNSVKLAPFDTLHEQDPAASINEVGRYLQEILS